MKRLLLGPQHGPDQEICRKWSLLRRCTWQKGSLPYFGFSQQEWADMGAEQQLEWQIYWDSNRGMKNGEGYQDTCGSWLSSSALTM